MSNINVSQGHVYVVYREGMTLRIPFAATNLFGESSPLSSSKLTASSIKEFIELAKEVSSLCQFIPQESGEP